MKHNLVENKKIKEIMEKNITIECPECSHQFEAADAFKKHLKKEEQRMNAELEFKGKALAERERQIDQSVAIELEKQRNVLVEKIEAQVLERQGAEMKVYKEELEKKREEVKTLKKRELEIEELKSKLASQGEDLELQYKRWANEQIQETRKQMKEQSEEEVTLKLREKEEIIENQRKQVTEMKRKIEQGSVQLQGEALELILEERLRDLYPSDEIDEIKKGANGADVLQTVIDQGKACGSILYETKNTQTFTNGWIDKLRTDQQRVNAGIAVLVTRAFPKEEKREFYFDQGVIVCNARVFPIVAALCRKKLVDLCQQSSRFEMQKDTMGLLYQYLTSDEFRMHIEETVHGIMAIKDQVDAERRAFERQWKERDKQADRMMTNLTQMFGSIKGIAPSVKDVKPLLLLN